MKIKNHTPKENEVEKIVDIIESIAHEKGLNIQEVRNTVTLALVKTAKKIYGAEYEYGAEIDPVSKSLKLYLFSFRNHGGFHEDCVNIIMKDLVKLMEPRYIEVWGKFTPRGGISIDPYCNYGKPNTKFVAMADFRLMNHDLYPEKVDNR